MPKRQRSDSTVEEDIITEYVDSCVDFHTNVKIVDTSKSHKYAENVLIIGTKEEIAAATASGLLTSLPITNADVAQAAARMTEEAKTLSVFANVDDGYKKITFFTTPSKASRTNCPYRPDAITEAVGAACDAMEVQDAGNAPRVLDIIALTPAGAEAAVCKAVASGSPHSFTAKSGAGAAGSAFKNKSSVNIHLLFAVSNASLHSESAAEGYAPAELEALMTYIQLCQRLVDTPTNYLDTVVFAEIAERYAEKLGCGIKVIKGQELQSQGYGGIYAVGKCAQYPPHLVTLHFENPHASAASGEAEKNIALVGKGLVYDCGGLALKPTAGMCNMKTDMGGAAAVFCGFLTVVSCMKIGKKAAKAYGAKNIRHLSVTLCLAENAIGPNAFRNDDIIIMKSGKSVEVKNTDAEGRICLGDGVHFATDAAANFFKPGYLIDMATLTGAQGIATGTKHAAIYANDADAESKVLEAGRSIGDTCFPVLYCPEYHIPQYKSPCADMRNIMHEGTDGGVSCAGYFVEANVSKEFTGKHIHVDLAFPSFDNCGATGYGVALITEYFKKI